MIISKIRGGLGNQFFTYAAGRCLSLIHDAPLLLDVSWYKSGPRPLWLKHFNIKAEITWEDQSGAADGIGFNQQHWSYYPEFQHYSGHKFLSGWWQSERFFEPVSEVIRKDLTLGTERVSRDALEYLNQIRDVRHGPYVAVHCRRMDYVGLAEKGDFNLLPFSYYQTAMSRFLDGGAFLVFSDDLTWCREHMSHPGIIFCDVDDALVAFTIMRNCDHYIIANSTFSWWAAWLGESLNSTVISPDSSDWFGPVLNAKYVTTDIIPTRWNQLPLDNPPPQSEHVRAKLL